MRVMSLILRGAPLVLVLGGCVDGPQLRPGVDFDTDGDFDEDIGRAQCFETEQNLLSFDDEVDVLDAVFTNRCGFGVTLGVEVLDDPYDGFELVSPVLDGQALRPDEEVVVSIELVADAPGTYEAELRLRDSTGNEGMFPVVQVFAEVE